MKELLNNKYTIKNEFICPFCLGRVGSRHVAIDRSINVCNNHKHIFCYQTKQLVVASGYIKNLINNKII